MEISESRRARAAAAQARCHRSRTQRSAPPRPRRPAASSRAWISASSPPPPRGRRAWRGRRRRGVVDGSSLRSRPAPSAIATARPRAPAPRARSRSPARAPADDRSTGRSAEIGVAALGADPLLVRRERRAVRACGFVASRRPLSSSSAEIREREEVRARVEDELRKSGGPPPADRLHRLAHLERVADRPAERLIHVREDTDDVDPCLAHRTRASPRRAPRILLRPHERALADLHVEHERARAAGDLLRHDARRDERDLVDRRRHIAQGIELAIGGHEIGALAGDREADLLHLRDELLDRELDAEAGDRRACRACRPCGRARGRSSSRTGAPHAATTGPSARVVLSPTPPVECLSTTRRPSRAAR